MLIMERWILGRLRNRIFYSLAELNQAIGELLVRLKRRTADPQARRDAAPAPRTARPADAQTLAVEPYVFAEWRIRRVGIDYHVDVDRHYYSVPYRFAKEAVEVRLTGPHRGGLRQG